MAGDSELEQLKKVARLQGYVRGQQATITKLEQQLEEALALLREACEAWPDGSVAYPIPMGEIHRCLKLGKAWYERVRSALAPPADIQRPEVVVTPSKLRACAALDELEGSADSITATMLCKAADRIEELQTQLNAATQVAFCGVLDEAGVEHCEVSPQALPAALDLSQEFNVQKDAEIALLKSQLASVATSEWDRLTRERDEARAERDQWQRDYTRLAGDWELAKEPHP